MSMKEISLLHQLRSMMRPNEIIHHRKALRLFGTVSHGLILHSGPRDETEMATDIFFHVVMYIQVKGFIKKEQM